MGDSSQAMGARQAESRTRPLVGKSKPSRMATEGAGTQPVRSNGPTQRAALP